MTDPTPPFTAPQAHPVVTGPPTAPAKGLAIAALVVGIAAFLFGLVPFLGLVVAIAGIVFGIIALRRGTARGFGVTGLILSGVALITNIVVIIVIALVAAGVSENSTTGDAASGDPAPAAGEQVIDTPCYDFEGPAGFISNISADAAQACATKLELWGDVAADGTIINTGVGSILGSVIVEPIRVSTSDAMSPDGTVGGMVDSMNTEYIPAFGTVISLLEPVTLDGAEGNLTRVESDAELTKTKALVIVRAPDDYQVTGEPVRFFLVTFVTPYDNGDELIDTVVESWHWN